MTRKDYIQVAEILHARKNVIAENEFQDLVADFSDYFFSDNPNFSYTRFEIACFGE